MVRPSVRPPVSQCAIQYMPSSARCNHGAALPPSRSPALLLLLRPFLFWSPSSSSPSPSPPFVVIPHHPISHAEQRGGRLSLVMRAALRGDINGTIVVVVLLLLLLLSLSLSPL